MTPYNYSPNYPPVNGETPDEDKVEMKDLTAMQMTNVVEISEQDYPELFVADNQPA
ncbi:hypothetical protein GCM10009066_00850 [Halarchaeum salinum]|uniref:Uncharacterized protein n=1 Tax=Halarchaeum salinum TaxID=489912 RepID=A0AAV3S3V7_9EURY